MPAEMKRLITNAIPATNQNLFEQAWTLLPNPDAQALSTVSDNNLSAWQVDPLRNLIQTSAARSPIIKRQLEPRLMHLLCLLAAADGNVISREQLMTALWPKVIVNENSLTRAVSELRKALTYPDRLNSASARCALIETISKKGYRLNASIHFNNKSSTAADASKAFARRTASRPSSLPRLHIVKSMMMAAALLMLPWSISLLVTQQPSEPDGWARSGTNNTANQHSAQLLEDRVLTNTPDLPSGVEWHESLHLQLANNAPASTWINQTPDRINNLSILSPSGDLLAFVEEFPGKSQLKLRNLNSPDESWTAFTSASPITRLQWSPLEDGILFTIIERSLVSTAALSDQSATDKYPVGRLMLLDLHSMQVTELYRREQSIPADTTNQAGSLT